MAAWCLPRNLQNDFLAAIRDGRLTPERLMAMTSAERRAAFAELLGDDNAREVNAQFEAKLLLKDQQRGLVTWARKIGGLTEATRRDMLAQINRLDKVLQPEEEQAFLEDLAAKRLGVSVTAQEAREITELAQKAEALRAQITAAGEGDYRVGYTEKAATDYGVALQRLIDKIDSLKPGGRTFQNAVLNILNLPQSALTSIFHFSAPFVQGWGMISTKEWYIGVARMLQYFASPAAYERLNGWIISHPDYSLAVDGKLGLTKITDKVTAREESMQSSLLQDLNQWVSDKTGLPNLIKAWSRSFTGYLNYVRASRFYNLLAAARLSGEDVSAGSANVRSIAKLVNDFTGRGDQVSLGVGNVKISPEAAAALNSIFFSPRKMAATIEMFNPVVYAQHTPFARRAAARQLFGSLAATGAVLTLAKLAGAQVNFDPRAQGFGKVGIGDGETLDMTGGNDSYARLLARLVSNQLVTSSGKTITLGVGGPAAPTRASLVAEYLRGKLAPVAGTIWTAAEGKDPIGRPFSMSQAAADEMTPIVMHSLLEVWMNSPHDAAHLIPALSAFLGVGVEDRAPPLSPNGRDVWGEQAPSLGERLGSSQYSDSWHGDPVNQEAERVGLNLNFPPDTIRGVKLTPQQYDDYIRLSGRLAHMRLEELISGPGYQTAEPANPTAQQLRESPEQQRTEEQLKELISARTGARKEAREELGLDTIGAPQ